MSKRLYQSSKESRVSVQAEARQMLWAAVPPSLHDNRKSWLSKAARAMGWGQRRTKAIFYCEARTITADEWRTLNQRLDALKKAERLHGEQIHEYRASYRMAGEVSPLAGGEIDPMGLGPASGRRTRHRQINEA